MSTLRTFKDENDADLDRYYSTINNGWPQKERVTVLSLLLSVGIAKTFIVIRTAH